MKLIEIGEYKFNLIESYEELVKYPAKLEKVIKLAIIGSEKLERPGYELLIKELLSISNTIFEKIEISIDQWIILKNSSKWVFTDKLLKRPFEYIKVGKEVFSLQDMNKARAVEVSLGLVYFTQMGAGEAEAANCLIATFCIPKGMKYSLDLFNETLPKIEKIPDYKKALILKYLCDSLADFIEEFKDMFGKGGKPIYEHGEGWYYMLGMVVKAGYYKSVNEVYEAPAVEVWGWMRNETLEVARAESERKTNNL
jgi:hypothetical protein